MRARDFILHEYSREKTATVFGNKLLLALQNDKSHAIGGTALGTSRAYLQQKAKVGSPVEDSNKTVIINDVLQTLENADPTANKEYVQWLAKVYANQGIKMEDLLSRGRQALDIYNTYKVKKILPPEYRDIGRIDFNTLEGLSMNADLRQALAAKQEQEAAKTMPRGDAEVVYENDQVRIIHPKDEAAACYYGQGTKWCTAATGGNNMFDNYNRGGPMYILLPKQPEYDGEKYQVHFDSGQYMDERDRPVPVLRLIKERFGDLMEFFQDREPGIASWIIFADNDTINQAVAKIKDIGLDYVYEILSDWEVNDTSYYNWLEEQGYYNEEAGEFDWDRIAEDNISYFDYNDEAQRYYDKAESSLDAGPDAVRDMAQELSDEYNDSEPYHLSDLDRVIAALVEYEFGTRRGHVEDGGLAEYIAGKVWVQYNPKTKEIEAGIVR